MIGLLADENFNRIIVDGIRRERPDVDIVRIQELGLAGAVDPVVLDWAAQQHRIVITHDVRTMTRHAYDRVAAGLSMPGVFEVPQDLAIRAAIDDLVLLAVCGNESEFEGPSAVLAAALVLVCLTKTRRVSEGLAVTAWPLVYTSG